MKFKDLYDQIEANPNKPVGFEFLRAAISDHHNGIQEVKVWRLSYNPPRRDAHFTLIDDRSSPYDGEFLVADISYCAALEREPDELMFALTKELMHVFDPPESRIDTKEKFVQFLKDLQNTPLDGQNIALETEHRARWMALVALCPMSLRTGIKAEIEAGKALKSEVAQRLGLPEWLIDVVLDDYYEEALGILMEL